MKLFELEIGFVKNGQAKDILCINTWLLHQFWSDCWHITSCVEHSIRMTIDETNFDQTFTIF
jgi:hypothetical protein